MAGLGGGTAYDKKGNIIPWGSSHPGWSSGASGLGSSSTLQADTADSGMVNQSYTVGSNPVSSTGGGSSSALRDIVASNNQSSGPSKPLDNSFQRNPVAERQNALLEQAANGDMNAPRMIDLANRKARDFATGSILEEQRNKQRLGQGGTGAEDLSAQKIRSDTQRNASGNAAAITIDRENARNDLRSKIIANAYGGDQIVDAGKRTAIAQYESASNVELAKERNQIAKTDQLLGLLRDPIYGSDFSNGGINAPVGGYGPGGLF